MVRVPLLTRQKQIDAFIEKHQNWIQKQRDIFSERKTDTRQYLFGEEYVFPEDMSREQKELFYRQQAKKYIFERTGELAKKYGFLYEKIRITGAKTRWGSCSSKKTLSFSYRLLYYPIECIDYVIIHELCHLRQMNHSTKFWKEVEAIMPNYAVAEGILKSKKYG